ncbi:hypothetical protein AAFF_G00326230 [Aldrovandia affinis]|uniref:Uncharacterized protein n=1 Tax=Aldrovandia affinis TaxID=143900 RepID=A0AAD7X1E7_9TELE|nr:hypothetical protein AAFF_G00326230 [Aldrovandia affinis]
MEIPTSVFYRKHRARYIAIPAGGQSDAEIESDTGEDFEESITLAEFEVEVGHALIQAGKMPKRKRGRPANEDNTKKRKVSTRPVADVRLDQVAHWPELVEEKQRCKLCIKSYSLMRCRKCNLSALCITRDRNCFVELKKQKTKQNERCSK